MLAAQAPLHQATNLLAPPSPPAPPPRRFNSSDLNIAYKMPVAEYTKLCEYSEALEENWGKPPGQLNSNGQELLIYGKQFGNVFIGVQVRRAAGAAPPAR